MTGVLYDVRQLTLVTTALLCNVIIVRTWATLPRIVLTRFPHQEHHIVMTVHTSNHWNDHNCRDRSQLPNYIHCQGRCFDWSRHYHQSHHGSTSNYWRKTSFSPSHPCSNMWYPSTDRCPRKHSHWDIPHRHNHNSSKTCHFSDWSHSHSYSMD